MPRQIDDFHPLSGQKYGVTSLSAGMPSAFEAQVKTLLG